MKSKSHVVWSFQFIWGFLGFFYLIPCPATCRANGNVFAVLFTITQWIYKVPGRYHNSLWVGLNSCWFSQRRTFLLRVASFYPGTWFWLSVTQILSKTLLDFSYFLFPPYLLGIQIFCSFHQIKFSALTLKPSALFFSLSKQVKTDVQGTMQSVFEKYDGKNPESKVVDYLQEQVRKYLSIVWKRTVGS